MSAEKFLGNERTRAEDIILGALGYDQGSRILSVEVTAGGYRGQARWDDGEVFQFESEQPPDALETWALQVLANPSRTIS